MEENVLLSVTPTSLVGAYTVTISPELGSGSYAHEAVHNTTNKKYAVKQISLMQDEKTYRRLLKRARKELGIIRRLQNHNNIVKLFDVVQYKSSMWIFMEYCSHKSLNSYLRKHANLDLLSKMKIKLQCASAIAYMHSQKPPITHRDIKVENILVTKQGDETVVKLTDFGLSKLLEEQSMSNRGMDTFVGTKYYMAPEQFQGQKYNESVDAFALGLAFVVVHDFCSENMLTVPLSCKYFKY